MLVAGWNSIRHEDLHARALIHTKTQPRTCWKVYGTSDSLSLASAWPRGAVARRVRSSSHLWFMNIDWSGLCGSFFPSLSVPLPSSPTNHHHTHRNGTRSIFSFLTMSWWDSLAPNTQQWAHLSCLHNILISLFFQMRNHNHQSVRPGVSIPQPRHKLRLIFGLVSYEQAGFFHGC